MKIGHLFWQPTPDMNYSHHQRLSETEELVQMCEQLGFWGVSFGENHFSNYGYSPNPLMLAVGLGRRTERLNIATGVAVLPYWNPIRFAEDAATADLLLNGRLELGVGRGYQQLEFEGFGLPYEERQERFTEALEIVLQAWTRPEIQVEGKYYRVPRAINVLPKPMTKPHPRMYVAAFHEDSLKFAASTDFKVFGVSQPVAGAAKRDHEIYMAERRRLGKDGDFFTVAMNRQVYVVDSSSPAKIEAWTHSAPVDWANESFAIAERAQTEYCVKQGASCDPPTGKVRIDAAYVEANSPIIREQFLKAGVRLAHLLDSTLGK